MPPGQFLLPRQSQEGCRPTLWCLVFCSPSDYFIMTQNCSSTYRDLVPFRQIIVTQDLSSIYRDWPARTTETNPHHGLFTRLVGRAKNASPRSASWRNANSLNRRAVMFKQLVPCSMSGQIRHDNRVSSI